MSLTHYSRMTRHDVITVSTFAIKIILTFSEFILTIKEVTAHQQKVQFF